MSTVTSNYVGSQQAQPEQYLRPLSQEEKQALLPKVKEYAEKVVLNLIAKKDLEMRKQQTQAREQQIQMQKQQQRAQEQELLVNIFYSTFGLKLTPKESVEDVLKTYLNDDSITLNMEKKCAKISSMKPIIKFLENHSEVKALNFSAYIPVVNENFLPKNFHSIQN